MKDAKSTTRKLLFVLIIGIIVGSHSFAQNNTPQSLWYAKGPDTVETNKIVNIHKKIHINGFVKSGNSLTFDGPNDRILGDAGVINLGGDVTLGQSFSNTRVGIGTQSPSLSLHIIGDGINSNGGILSLGSTAAGPVLPPGLTDNRLIWYPRKRAFRAGVATAGQWDDPNIGLSSFATGENTTASGAASAAFGQSTAATNTAAMSIGSNTLANGRFAFAGGSNTTAESDFDFVFGSDATTFGASGGKRHVG